MNNLSNIPEDIDQPVVRAVRREAERVDREIKCLDKEIADEEKRRDSSQANLDRKLQARAKWVADARELQEALD